MMRSLAIRRLCAESLESRTLMAADLAPVPAAIDGSFAPGDANQDGFFDSQDLIQVFQSGKYETGEMAGWNEGDWNHDQVFDSSDLVLAMNQGNYGQKRTSPVDAVQQHSDVVWFDGVGPVGHAVLIRTTDGVSAQVTTGDLTPGAYTLWWIVFNNSDGCGEACGDEPADFDPLTTGFDFGYADGDIVGPDGTVTFAAHLHEGDVLLEGGKLDDAMASEIHVVVRNHGPVDADRLFEQLHTGELDPGFDCDFDPNCDLHGGATGDIQFAEFPPVL